MQTLLNDHAASTTCSPKCCFEQSCNCETILYNYTRFERNARNAGQQQLQVTLIHLPRWHITLQAHEWQNASIYTINKCMFTSNAVSQIHNSYVYSEAAMYHQTPSTQSDQSNNMPAWSSMFAAQMFAAQDIQTWQENCSVCMGRCASLRCTFLSFNIYRLTGMPRNICSTWSTKTQFSHKSHHIIRCQSTLNVYNV